jgi:hypothetical protein
MPWNARFLCLSFILFGLSLTILVFASPDRRAGSKTVLGLVIIWSAVSLPLHCGQRRPLDLWNTVFARQEVMLRQRLEVKPVYQDVIKMRAQGDTPWFLVAGENAWTLPFLMHSEFRWRLTPSWEQVTAASANAAETGDAYALVLNAPLPPNFSGLVLKSYPSSTYILRWKFSEPPGSQN